MGEYVKTVIGVSLLSGIISIAAPKEGSGKAFRLVCGVFVLFCLILPLNKAVKNLSSLKTEFKTPLGEYSAEDTGQYTLAVIKKELELNVNACVKQITGADAINIETLVDRNGEEYSVKEITITVSEAYMPKATPLKELVFSRFGITPEVIT